MGKASLRILIELTLLREGRSPLRLVARRVHRNQGDTHRVLLWLEREKLVVRGGESQRSKELWELSMLHPWVQDNPFRGD